MANTLVSTSGGNSSVGEKVMSLPVGRRMDSLFADEQHEDEAVRRAELLNDGLVCLGLAAAQQSAGLFCPLLTRPLSLETSQALCAVFS